MTFDINSFLLFTIGNQRKIQQASFFIESVSGSVVYFLFTIDGQVVESDETSVGS